MALGCLFSQLMIVVKMEEKIKSVIMNEQKLESIESEKN
jgi:hypothetical protein